MAALAISEARMRVSVTIRQMFSCTTKSIRIDARIAKANAEPSFAVKVAVWVMKPGPMAEVAMRKIAAIKAPRRVLADMPLGAAWGAVVDVCSMLPSRLT